MNNRGGFEEGDKSCLKDGSVSLYKGVKCQECEEDYFREKITKKCTKCADRDITISLIIIIFLCALLYFFIIIR